MSNNGDVGVEGNISALERDKLLKRWVEQPPANPNMQYLRDAERRAALHQLGRQEGVLDLASESNVTKEINADNVARLDFSTAASAHAQQVLGDSVTEYAVTDPEWPQLPFDDSEFDAAVSIGPFDWKFLDVDRLLTELHRVLGTGGLFVFSVPTPKSPYSAADSYRFRYFTPEEAHRTIPPHWWLVDTDLLFQYPEPIHTVINKLPNGFQVPFVDFAETLSERLTAMNWWDAASYLVFGIEPIDYESYLNAALECLFRPVEEDGFWDTDEGKIIRALEYSFEDEGLGWTSDDSVEWRYAPFALMGVLQWRASPLGTETFDEKVRRELEYFTEQVADQGALDAMPSYGVGPLIVAFSLADGVFGDSRYVETARALYEYSRNRFDFTHAEDSLLLFGWSHLYRHDPDDELLADIAEALWTVNERLDSDGVFQFDNSTTHRHQNQMYTLWGLCEGISVTDTPGYLDSAEQVLDYAIENRMRDDGAFLWDEPSTKRRIKRAIHKRLGGRPPHWDFLYECHQTFFVNAVMGYYKAGGNRNYDQEVREAMSWIYANNGLGVDLVEYSGLGVPMRQMTVDTRMDVPGQMYKGAYEIGSYLMAITHLLTRY